ncbi:hypothetical protein E3N88_37865 [Mikania micrantha]|uniref:SWIM-type domain-containing protein n=1 Tax=Mikania micrantha TaxID=192012 RepID=A0A5N6LSC3_9ASTR|nr:hypothetical protein E3N88_37865 [Mikania micrantha]
MFAIRNRWVPAYFREIQMCCLMKTTSRCESSNASFKMNSGSVQKEIIKGMMLCFITNYEKTPDGVETFTVHHADKRSNIINEFQVEIHLPKQVLSCTCMGFTRIGYLCRHVFCVFRYKKVEKIPDDFIIRRWTKNLLPSNLFSSDKLLAGDNSEMSLKMNELMDLVTQCMDLLIGDVEEFDSFFEQIKDMKQNLFEKLKIEASTRSRLSEIRDLVGDFDDSEVLFSALEGIRNKGSRGKKRRVVGPHETAAVKSKKTLRKCRTCQELVYHDTRNCPLNNEDCHSDQA